MHILKNTKSFALGAAVYALTLEFLLLGRFVYDTMMKEHTVLELAVPGFLVCLGLGWVVFGLFARRWSKTGTFAGVMLILWAAFLAAIPFISIDLTLRLAPINKINYHSLYIFYVLAGVGALNYLWEPIAR